MAAAVVAAARAVGASVAAVVGVSAAAAEGASAALEVECPRPRVLRAEASARAEGFAALLRRRRRGLRARPSTDRPRLLLAARRRSPRRRFCGARPPARRRPSNAANRAVRSSATRRPSRRARGRRSRASGTTRSRRPTTGTSTRRWARPRAGPIPISRTGASPLGRRSPGSPTTTDRGACRLERRALPAPPRACGPRSSSATAPTRGRARDARRSPPPMACGLAALPIAPGRVSHVRSPAVTWSTPVAPGRARRRIAASIAAPIVYRGAGREPPTRSP